MAELWELDTYITPIDSCFNRTIIEYDMKRANTSLAREYKLLPEDIITKIENMPKQDRQVAIGQIKRDTPGYSEAEKEGFKQARKLFFEANEIKPEDVLDIKKDAIFLLREIKNEQVTENINFRFKNIYSSYVRFGKSLELFYYNDKLDVKGISDEIYEEKHAPYMGSLFCDGIRRMERSTKDEALKYLRLMYDYYKWLKLDTGYYREFNPRSMFRYKNGDYAGDEYLGDLKELNIQCNLNRILSFIRIII